MTDNEIIKALECCICSTSRNDCENLNCPACQEIGCYFMNRSTEYYPESLIQEIGKSVLDLINRLQAENDKNENIIRLADKAIETANAEIEQWKEEANKYQNLWCIAVDDISKIKSEAIKEFAERLKKSAFNTRMLYSSIVYELGEDDIDNLVKEMTEVNEK